MKRARDSPPHMVDGVVVDPETEWQLHWPQDVWSRLSDGTPCFNVQWMLSHGDAAAELFGWIPQGSLLSIDNLMAGPVMELGLTILLGLPQFAGVTFLGHDTRPVSIERVVTDFMQQSSKCWRVVSNCWQDTTLIYLKALVLTNKLSWLTIESHCISDYHVGKCEASRELFKAIAASRSLSRFDACDRMLATYQDYILTNRSIVLLTPDVKPSFYSGFPGPDRLTQANVKLLPACPRVILMAERNKRVRVQVRKAALMALMMGRRGLHMTRDESRLVAQQIASSVFDDAWYRD